MSVRKNLLANYLGQGWVALMGFAFIPSYIKYLGMEAYGLIGVFALLQAWLAILDMGMTPAINREMARFKAGAHSSQSIHDLLHIFEFIVFFLSLVVAALVWILGPWLATNWLKVEILDPTVVAKALSFLGVVVSLRLWEGLYKGALQGLQQMVWLNAANTILATIRWGGSAAVLAWISPTIGAFFVWQAVVSFLAAIILGLKIYKWLPNGWSYSRLNGRQISRIWEFSGGLFAIALLSLLLSQMDKIVISRLLSLDRFGYYVLAATAANALYQLVYPLTNTMYPRFTELVTLKQEEFLVNSYHRACQLMSILIIPPALTLALFAKPILFFWTQNAIVAEESAPYVVPLVLAALCHGFMNLPYVLQLATGWTNLAIRINIVALAVLLPTTYLMTSRYGAVGAAYSWFALNVGNIIFGIHFMHHRLLVREKWNWYVFDLGIPLVVTGSIGIICWWCMPIGLSPLSQISWIAAVVIILFVSAVMSTTLRGELWRKVQVGIR